MIKLVVPSAGGGEEEGLNDPGVEFFLGNIERHLARESAQNTIDAALPNNAPVTLSFDLLSAAKADIPCVDSLADILRRCREFWRSNRKSEGFFADALRILENPTVKVLRMSDHNTTGLTGDDTDRDGRWYGLVRSAGVSNKDEGAGGSYGIGKYAPFAASQLRTVFYSTRTVDNEVAFQGTMRLASHTDRSGRITRRTGYIGSYCAETDSCVAVRQSSEIPALFRRGEPGTDISVIGYRDDSGWEQRLISSILANFWPAIHRNIIGFRVGNRLLSAATLAVDLAGLAQEDQEFDAHLYHKALTHGQRHETEIKNLGRVELYLFASDEELPKRVTMTRKTGMVIELKMFRSRRPFSGYLVCESPEGNELLRTMEPPRHDEWDPKRGTRVAAKALKALHDWIRDRVKELNPVPTAQALDVPDLARYLPFDEEADQQVPSQSGAEPDADEQFSPVTPVRDLQVRPAADARPRVLENTDKGGDVWTDGGSGDAEGGSGGGTGGGNGDDGVGAGAGGGAGQRPSRTPVAKPKLTLRSFRRADGSYELVVRATGGHAAAFRVLAVGEDGRTEPAALKSARDAITNAALAVNGARIAAPTSPKHATRVVAEFHTPLRLALAVEAL